MLCLIGLHAMDPVSQALALARQLICAATLGKSYGDLWT
jgi:hypothetical protein